MRARERVPVDSKAFGRVRPGVHRARNDPELDVEKAWVSLRAERALRGETKGVPWETVRDEVRALVDLRSKAL